MTPLQFLILQAIITGTAAVGWVVYLIVSAINPMYDMGLSMNQEVSVMAILLLSFNYFHFKVFKKAKELGLYK